MFFKLANIDDLEDIKTMYEGIVDNMNKNNICIWNKYYPFDFFESDINNHQLYLLKNEDEIVASCAICDSSEAKDFVNWENKNAKAFYIDRLGVKVDYQGKGYGSLLIKNSIELAQNNGIDYLRLFVVDINKPAMCLYEKNGFKRLDEMYIEKINDNLSLKEYVYEMKIN